MSQENEYIEAEEVLEEEVETDEVDTELEYNDSEEVDWKQVAENEKARRIKAEKAIIKDKKKKQTPVKKETVSKYDNQVDSLRINGVPMAHIEQLKKISELENIDLIDAKDSELFNLWKQKNEQEVKQKQATMPTSKRGRVVNESLDTVKQRVMTGKATAEDFARVRSGK